jgi:hypothetical protein
MLIFLLERRVGSPRAAAALIVRISHIEGAGTEDHRIRRLARHFRAYIRAHDIANLARDPWLRKVLAK